MMTSPIKSLRARLLLSVIVGMVALQVVSSVIVYVLQRHALYERFDQTITSTVRALVPLVKYDKPRGVHLDIEKSSMPEFQRTKGPDYFQVWRLDGSVVARSQTLGDGDLARVSQAQKPAKYDCDLRRGEKGRAVQISVEIQQKGPPEKRDAPEAVTLVVAKETKPVRDDLRALAWILSGTSLLGAIVAGALALAVVSHGLRPLGGVARQIGQVEPSALGRRIDMAGLPTEMQPVAQRLNEMLGRLQAAFDRERGFTADVAHEFRNPLAAIRSVGEVALSSPQTLDEYRQDIAEMVGLSRDMQAMVEKLLLLARLEAGHVPLKYGPVDLGEVVAVALANHGPGIASRAITLANRCPEHLEISADRDLLNIIVNNVIENAIEYVDAGGRITIQGNRDGKKVVLAVSNTGCELAPEVAAQVFDRFWRADASRSATGAHAGLGLSLVQRAVVVMGGIATATVDDGHFALRIQFQSQ